MRISCGACERRRKALAAKREAKLARGRKVQAAAIGAVLAVTEAVGMALDGQHGVDSERRRQTGEGTGSDR